MIRSVRRAVRRPSRIALRLFAFNLLVIFVPVAAVLYLDTYESRLRDAQEDGLVQQARLLAAALGDRPALDPMQIAAVFVRLERRSQARYRVYDAAGQLIADSARQAASSAEAAAKYPSAAQRDVRTRWLYRIGSSLAQARNRLSAFTSSLTRGGSVEPRKNEPEGMPPEVQAALAGQYRAATRPTPGQRSVTMFSGVPVLHQGQVTGAVVASQSTFQILSALYAIRLRLFEIVVASLMVAAVLTAFAATTIVRPLTRLRRQASALADRRGPLPSRFAGADRRDEVGELARALGELARRTNDHIQLLQSFSADISHELKNPLASIRTAAEMMADSESETERRRFLDLMVRDVGRLERLVSGLRDVARVEGQIEADVLEPVDVRRVLEALVESANAAPQRSVRVSLDVRGEPAVVLASRERLWQVFDNVLTNAISFSTDGAAVSVTLDTQPPWTCIVIEDSGPGIPDAHLARIFDRFFSYRPAEAGREHVGLGLAIARQIVESYGGTIAASNRESGGARFEVRLRSLSRER
jgi:two-component system sensor histidine kinase ChvG